MKKRIKKQLKEDEFVSTINKVFGFIKNRTKELIALCILIVVVILVIIGMRWVKSGQIKKESEILTQIFEISGQLKENPDKVQELQDLAGNGNLRRVAYIQLASYWAGEEEYEKAEAELLKMPDKRKDVFYYKAKDMLGQIYIEQEKFDEAISLYDKISEDPRDYTRDVLLFHKAQALEEKGDLDGALDVYKVIQEEFPQTYYGYEAMQKIEKQQEQDKNE